MPHDFYTINCKRTSKTPKYFNLKIPCTLLLLLNFYIPSIKEAEGLTETLKNLDLCSMKKPNIDTPPLRKTFASLHYNQNQHTSKSHR